MKTVDKYWRVSYRIPPNLIRSVLMRAIFFSLHCDFFALHFFWSAAARMNVWSVQMRKVKQTFVEKYRGYHSFDTYPDFIHGISWLLEAKISKLIAIYYHKESCHFKFFNFCKFARIILKSLLFHIVFNIHVCIVAKLLALLSKLWLFLSEDSTAKIFIMQY